jgi:hypothetical protein
MAKTNTARHPSEGWDPGVDLLFKIFSLDSRRSLSAVQVGGNDKKECE